MTELFVDIETYSDVDLRSAGVYRYAASPAFLVLMAAWAVDDGPVEVAVGRAEIESVPHLRDWSVRHVAHNATFERVCLSPGGSYDPPEHWHDTMAVAGERGRPQKLDHLGRSLGGELKDGAGTALVNFFCKPNRAGVRNLPQGSPEKWAAFVEYCRQDVVTLRDVHRRLGDFPTETERQVYLADQRINDRGVRVDVELARRASEAAQDNRMVQELEISALTGVRNPSSQPQLLGWLRGRGCGITDLQAETIASLLPETADPLVRRVLELRQELALVAAKKFVAALSGVGDDGRLRGQFRFFGAHTGRWAGRGVQLHNLPRAAFKSALEDGEAAARDVARQTGAAVLDLKMGLGASAETLKKLVRPMLLGPLVVCDYASIEARVIAWLAGEMWALDAFASGRDIYTETAARMSTPGSVLTRAQGKVACLALGYAGGVGALRHMGAEGDDDELQSLVDVWRRANPAIVGLWKVMGGAFRYGGAAGRRVSVEVSGDDRLVRLPSGRSICYHGVRFEKVEGGYGQMSQISFDDPARPGARGRTYGGRLTENITQAVARDILGEALVRLDDGGLRVVGHVHDEVLVEPPATLSEVRRMMVEPPAWASGLPIDASGFVCERYRKG